MSTWEASLVKRSLSEWLIDECVSSVPQAEQGTWRAELSPRVSAPSDLKKLRKAVADLKRMVPTEQGESLSDELREIVDDARWAKTQRGNYVLEVNQWLQPFHAEFRAKRAFSNVMIGGHADRIVVYIGGFVDSQETYKQLMEYVVSKRPPFKLMPDVRIGSWNGPHAE